MTKILEVSHISSIFSIGNFCVSPILLTHFIPLLHFIWSYGNQSFDLHNKSNDWFAYEM